MRVPRLVRAWAQPPRPPAASTATSWQRHPLPWPPTSCSLRLRGSPPPPSPLLLSCRFPRPALRTPQACCPRRRWAPLPLTYCQPPPSPSCLTSRRCPHFLPLPLPRCLRLPRQPPHQSALPSVYLPFPATQLWPALGRWGLLHLLWTPHLATRPMLRLVAVTRARGSSTLPQLQQWWSRGQPRRGRWWPTPWPATE